ncbi:hypothetical protein CPB83DRAFT_660321 [Crepidotus variabilis]|uniref:Uncharacterized protein n=1 Tax=Crepidotus variabilis TaxID=179855 RepID=A0A9P6EM04_9AGAR|nr:hypothetical protein CPB83DRAFT_660321 [Crepidotus variabilis]
MSLDIKIVPFNDVLDLFGEPDASSAYSLSGHVAVSVSSPFSLFDFKRSTRLLLQSLSLTFEGHSEIFTPSTGYSAVRLCTMTHDLIYGEPIELSNDGHDNRDRPCAWNIVFNLPIPGWLPASNSHGIDDVGVRYNLFATARFATIDEDHHASWSPFSALCSPFRSRNRTAETLKAINLRRFIAAPGPSNEPSEASMCNFLINSTPIASKTQRKFPSEILSKIQVLVSTSEYIDMDATEFPLSVRLRTKDLSAEECSKIQLKHIVVDITQTEKFRARSSPGYLAQYPVPPKNLQPPNVPLRDPSAMSTVFEIGMFSPSHLTNAIARTFSLLPATESGKYVLGENNYCFKDDPEEETPTWYTINTSLPFDTRSSNEIDSDELSWAGQLDLRPSSSGPLFDVHHDVSISLTCTYDLEDGEVAEDSLKFKVPIAFGKVPAPVPSRHWTPTSSTSTMDGQPAPIYGPQVDLSSSALPAYSQLYDRNGDRKIDYSIPLPLYTPRTSTSKEQAQISLVSPLPFAFDPSTSNVDGEKQPKLNHLFSSHPDLPSSTNIRRPSII